MSALALQVSICSVKRSNVIFRRLSDEMDTIGARLRYLRELAQLTQAQVAAKCDVSGQAVTAWEVGRNKLTIDNLLSFWRLTNCDLHWLLTGEGIRAELMLGQNGEDKTNGPQFLGRFIPMLTPEEVTSLKGSSLDQVLAARGEKILQYRTQYPCGPNSYWWKISDNANEPIYHSGDRVCIDPDEGPAAGDYVLVEDEKSGAYYFGEYVQSGPQKDAPFRIKFTNEKWGQISSSDVKLRIEGTMTEHARPRRR